MSVLKRAKRIFSQNWDEMCERFKDPEADMENALRGMEQSLSELRQTAAMRITDKNLIDKQIKELQEDFAETKAVRGKLELSLKPDDAPKKKAGPKPVTRPSASSSSLLRGGDAEDGPPKPTGRAPKAPTLDAPTVPRPSATPAPKVGD